MLDLSDNDNFNPLQLSLDSELKSSSIPVDKNSSEDLKIQLFLDLFMGRSDCYALKYVSSKSGKSGFMPVCKNAWKKGICPRIKRNCPECKFQKFDTDWVEMAKNHLVGYDKSKNSQKDFVAGVYPLLPNDTCRLGVIQANDQNSLKTALSISQVSEHLKTPTYLEKIPNGFRIWLFLAEPVQARSIRELLCILITLAMEIHPNMNFQIYDQIIPNQDKVPKGSFGSVIELPLQKKNREQGSNLFVDRDLNPVSDQWNFLSHIQRIDKKLVSTIIDYGIKTNAIHNVPSLKWFEKMKFEQLNNELRIARIKMTRPKQAGKTVKIILSNQIYIATQFLSTEVINLLLRSACFLNSEFMSAQDLRLSTFEKSLFISGSSFCGTFIAVPRALLETVVSLFRHLGIDCKISDRRQSGQPILVKFKGSLWIGQKKAAEAMLNSNYGTLAATTAFGKTVLAAYLIAQRKVNTLILVHRRNLMDQWLERLNEFLEIAPNSIGNIGAGKRKPTGIIDVAIIQSLYKSGRVDEIIKNYGYVIIDECHHVSAKSFELVAKTAKAKYLTGLSATVIRKDGHHPLIFLQCGPIRYEVDAKSEAAKRPFEHIVIARKTKFTLQNPEIENSQTAINVIFDLLTSNTKRNELIVRDALKAVKAGRFPLLLTERVDHLKLLAAALEQYIQNVIVLKGGMSNKSRDEALLKIEHTHESGERIILATGKYIGEGFDETRLDTILLAYPISWEGTLAQYAGRLHRLQAAKKKVMIIDYVDADVKMLMNMYRKRKRGYLKIGYTIQPVSRTS